jgi:polysaccharide biosynthesis transport protein
MSRQNGPEPNGKTNGRIVVPPSPSPSPPADLRELVSVLNRRKWTIASITALTVAAALFFSFRQTPVYASKAKILVKPPTTNQALQGIPAVVSMDTERELIQSSVVATLAVRKLDPALSPDSLLGHLSVSVPVNTQILEITYSDPDPVVAEHGAQAFAESYLKYKTDQALNAFKIVQADIQGQLERLRSRLDEANQLHAATKPGTPEEQQAQNDIDVLTSQIGVVESQLESLSVAEIDPGDVVQPASLQTSPVSPNHVRNGALALVVGLTLGIGAAFLRERLDDRLRGRGDLEGFVGAPVLAVVPTVSGWRRGKTRLQSLEAPKSAHAEAYRSLRTSLQFSVGNEDLRVIMVTSAMAGEGKTTTAANLAVTLAQGGKRVIVISADLRKPRLHRFFGLGNEVGVTSILEGRVGIAEAAQRPQGADTLRVLASGPVPQNPAELVESEAMDSLLDELRHLASFVVIDSPPLLVVSDPLVLASRSDGVIVVADAEASTRSAIVDAREQLEQVGSNVVGCVLNNYDPSKAGYYPYYYRYRYEYRASREDEPASGNGRTVTIRDPESMWR